jgi:hypothetical protein
VQNANENLHKKQESILAKMQKIFRKRIFFIFWMQFCKFCAIIEVSFMKIAHCAYTARQQNDAANTEGQEEMQ